jgi:hypothetical protein
MDVQNKGVQLWGESIYKENCPLQDGMSIFLTIQRDYPVGRGRGGVTKKVEQIYVHRGVSTCRLAIL